MGTATKNYTVSKGCAFIALESEGNDSLRDIGNSPGLQLTTTVEKTEHYSSKSGPAIKDAQIITKLTVSGQLTCDVLDPENLRLFALGTLEKRTQSAINLVTAEDYTAKHDRHFKLKVGGETGTLRVINVSDVVIKDGATELITYVEGDDYEVLAREGLIFIPATSSITDGQDLKITYDAALSTFEIIKGGKVKQIRAWLYFYGNPDAGYIEDLYLFCSISPSGDILFVSEADIQTITFDFEVLDNALVDGLYELEVVGVVTAA